MLTVGSRAQVWNGNAKKTRGGLTKKDLFKKKGRIKSKKASKKAKKNNNLKNAGWTFKKGVFGAIRIEDKNKTKKNRKKKGGGNSGRLVRTRAAPSAIRAPAIRAPAVRTPSPSPTSTGNTADRLAKIQADIARLQREIYPPSPSPTSTGTPAEIAKIQAEIARLQGEIGEGESVPVPVPGFGGQSSPTSEAVRARPPSPISGKSLPECKNNCTSSGSVDLNKVGKDRDGFYYMHEPSKKIRLDKVGDLGEGGFGTVELYESSEYLPGTNERVELAIKTHFDMDNLLDEAKKSRFISDNRLCNLVNTRYLPAEDGTHYIIMNVAEGDISRLDPDDGVIRSVDRQLSTLLFCLAKQGIYYPDLKPANILYKPTSDGPIIFLGDIGSLCSVENQSELITDTAPATYPYPGCRNRAQVYCDRETGDKFTIYLFGLTMMKFISQSHKANDLYFAIKDANLSGGPPDADTYANLEQQARQSGLDITKYTGFMKNWNKLPIDSILQ